MSKFKLNEKGFVFIEVIFLTMIVSFTAIIIFNGLNLAIKSNRVSAIRMNAIHLANARMAEIEEYVDSNKTFPPSSYTLLKNDDLVYENFFGIIGTTKFSFEPQPIIVIDSNNPNKGNVTVTVTWTVNGNDYGMASDDKNNESINKDIWIIETSSEN